MMGCLHVRGGGLRKWRRHAAVAVIPIFDELVKSQYLIDHLFIFFSQLNHQNEKIKPDFHCLHFGNCGCTIQHTVIFSTSWGWRRGWKTYRLFLLKLTYYFFSLFSQSKFIAAWHEPERRPNGWFHVLVDLCILYIQIFF